MKKLYAYEHLEPVQRRKWDSISQIYRDSIVAAKRIIHFADIDIPWIKIDGVKWTRAEEYDIVVGA